MKTVIKRDGRIVDFDKQKIVEAIMGAMTHVEKDSGRKADPIVAQRIADFIEARRELSMEVEAIQDLVQQKLMESTRKDVAEKYVQYRYSRTVARESKTKDVFFEVINIKANEVTRENANMNTDTPAGQMMKFASETTKSFANNYLLSEKARRAHLDGLIHIHDQDYYPTKSLTCVQHPLDKILKNGFRAGHGASRPSKRIETASILGCISLETAQNEMHGGQAIPAFDFYLAPYVRMTFEEELKDIADNEDIPMSEFEEWLELFPVKDYVKKPVKNIIDKIAKFIQIAINRTVKRVHQAVEAFIHNMNTIHSRGGNQVVFSSINYGTDTSPEGRCVIRETLLSTERGVGNSETAIFPIQIWKKKRGVNYLEEDPNYDLFELACRVSAKRFFPNFINLDATFNQHPNWRADDPLRYLWETATMGCRTRVFEDRFGDYTSIGRGNISFTTINIVRIAIECMIEYPTDMLARIDTFFERLKEVLDIVAEQLDERYQFQATALAKQFPLVMSSLWKGGENLAPEDTIADVIKHGTLGIGFIGLAECLKALVGVHHGEDAEAQNLGLEIVSFMRDKAKEYCDKYDHNYSILATPAEGLSGRFTKIDRKKFGVLEGITDRDYYTNSNHVPVYYQCSASHKATVEAPYHDLTRGGHIFYVEMDGDATQNIDAVKGVVQLMDKLNMGYVSINHTKFRCLDCGHEWVESSSDESSADCECKKCGSVRVSILQRITGYLVGTTDRWNFAKNKERLDRVIHVLGRKLK
jgi:ribonucleoside-triphosphate reductase